MSTRVRVRPGDVAHTNVGARRVRSGKRMSALARRDAIAGYLLISPAFLLFLIFIAGPLVGAVALSLFQWDLLTPAQFAGLGNYKLLFSDPVVGQAILNTFVFTFWSIVLHKVWGCCWLWL